MIKYIRPLSSLSADDLAQIERAAEVCRILPGLLVECVLRHDYRLLPAVQWRRLEAHLLDERARQVFESIFAAADAADDLRAFAQSRDDDTPGTAPEHQKRKEDNDANNRAAG